jgi:hypothetical protein
MASWDVVNASIPRASREALGGFLGSPGFTLAGCGTSIGRRISRTGPLARDLGHQGDVASVVRDLYPNLPELPRELVSDHCATASGKSASA